MDESGATKTPSMPLPNPVTVQKLPLGSFNTVLTELKVQKKIAVPLIAMNLTWFAKIAITTAFLGRLGGLQLAGGTLGFTFANVTGFSVLTGLCNAMEPICGQAYGAKNFKLLHKTLVMTVSLLLLTTLPISFLWLNVEKILVYFGQDEDISHVAKTYLYFLLPDLVITSFLCPIKAYLSSQSVTIPIMFSSALGVVLHIPINILLSKARGLQGVSMACWITDLLVVIFLSIYMCVTKNKKGVKWSDSKWWDQGIRDWTKLLRLCGPCCLTTCLEWWCIEILVLLTGRLDNPKQAVGILAIVLNFDYLVFSIMLSLSTCASIRVSNELGANQARPASLSTYVSMGTSLVLGLVCCILMIAARGVWGPLFSHDVGVTRGVKKLMLIMATVELVNFPLCVCGGIMRGTAKPWLAMYANLGGFYLLALPLGVVLAFRVRLGLSGLIIGFLVGVIACLALLLVFIMRIDWEEETSKSQVLARTAEEPVIDESENRNLATLQNVLAS